METRGKARKFFEMETPGAGSASAPPGVLAEPALGVPH
jgi:hypothetical protein